MNIKLFFKNRFLDIFPLVLILVLIFLCTFLIPLLLIKLLGFFDFLLFVPSLSFAIFIVLSIIILLKKEKRNNRSLQYLNRLRLKRLYLKPLLISIAIWLIAVCLQSIFNLALEGDIDLGIPVADFALDLSGYEIKNKTTVYLLPIGIIFIAFAEELFWRGYLLPLQEEKWGKYSWVINGTLWGLTHIFIYNFWSMIFIFFAIPYIAYKYKNTSITIIIHVLINFLSAIYWINTILPIYRTA